MEQKLITLAELTDSYDISKNTDKDRLDVQIWRAQRLDVKPVLGEALYYDLMENISDPKYILLLDGGSYSPSQYEVYFQGLKDLTSAFAYSRLAGNNDTFITNKGNKIKLSEQSTEQTKSVTDNNAQQAVSDAIAIAEGIRRFLDKNPDDYPLYRVSNTGHDQMRSSFTFIKV
jgi:hypothetical protein